MLDSFYLGGVEHQWTCSGRGGCTVILSLGDWECTKPQYMIIRYYLQAYIQICSGSCPPYYPLHCVRLGHSLAP